MHLTPVDFMLYKGKVMRSTAEKLGLDVSTLSRWRKRNLIPAEKQIEISKLFGITPKEILYGKEVSEKSIKKDPRTEYLATPATPEKKPAAKVLAAK